jgi:hypothetical protein
MTPIVPFRKMGTLALSLLAIFGLTSQSRADSLTTLFGANNANNFGGMVFFDLDVLSPGGITIHSIDVNAGGDFAALVPITGSPISSDVYIRTGTYNGNTLSSAGWNLVSSGTGTAAAPNSPSFIDLSDFSLASGITGVAIRNNGYSANYTNGSNIFSNANLKLTTGAATNSLFGPSTFEPRTWNGTINYTTAVTPEAPGGVVFLAALLPLGLLALKNHRKKAALAS